MDKKSRVNCLVCFISITAVLAVGLWFPGQDCATAGDATKDLRIGFVTYFFREANLDDAKLAMEIWTKTLSKKMRIQYRLKITYYNDLDSMAAAARKGEIDILSTSSYDYLTSELKEIATPIAVGMKNGTVYEKYLLLAHKEANLNNIGQLKGKKIIIKNDRSGIAMVWLNSVLRKNSLQESSFFFKNIKNVENASQAVLPVYFRQADACCVTQNTYATTIELNPNIEKKLKVLCESPDYIPGFSCARKGVDHELSDVYIDVGVHLNAEPEGKQMLVLFRLDRIVPYDPSFLRNVEALVRECNQLKKKK